MPDIVARDVRFYKAMNALGMLIAALAHEGFIKFELEFLPEQAKIDCCCIGQLMWQARQEVNGGKNEELPITTSKGTIIHLMLCEAPTQKDQSLLHLWLTGPIDCQEEIILLDSTISGLGFKVLPESPFSISS